MKYLFLQALCKSIDGDFINNSSSTGNLNGSYGVLRDCRVVDPLSDPVYLNIDGSDNDKDPEANSGAVMYIVAVLVFYSAGIVIMIIKYLRREKRELEEERILEDFFRSMPACKKEREQDNVNRVAIHAFHALTAFNDPTQIDMGNINESIVTYADTTLDENDDYKPVSHNYPNVCKTEKVTCHSETLVTDV